MINYELAKKQGPKLKAALTRAKNIKDPEKRWVATKNACIQAVVAWKQWGAWPDNWALWQCALYDAFNAYRQWAVFTVHANTFSAKERIPSYCPKLEEL